MTDSLRRTPLYDEHVKAKGRIVPFAGWEMPVQYAGISAEHEAVRTRAGLFDVSHMGELELNGEHAASVVDYLVTNSLARVEPGQAMYTCCCNEQGSILDDLIIYKRAPDRILVVCNASNRDKISRHFAHAAKDHCEFSDVSDSLALVALQGPKALAVVAAAGTDLGDVAGALGPFRFGDGKVAGVSATVARTGYTGEDGVEIFCASDDPPALWPALMAAGEGFRLPPSGLGARAPCAARSGRDSGSGSMGAPRISAHRPSEPIVTNASRHAPSNTARRNGRLSSNSLATTTPASITSGSSAVDSTSAGCRERCPSASSTAT